jgi:hypothetical protein
MGGYHSGYHGGSVCNLIPNHFVLVLAAKEAVYTRCNQARISRAVSTFQLQSAYLVQRAVTALRFRLSTTPLSVPPGSLRSI